MTYSFRKCEPADLPFFYRLKEQSFRWYVEKLYGWNEEFQLAWAKRELEEHMDVIKIIRQNGHDIGVFTFYHDEAGDACIDTFALLPEYRSQGIGTQILTDILQENRDTRVYLKTYKENPARHLYERVGFRKYGETDTHWLMER